MIFHKIMKNASFLKIFFNRLQAPGRTEGEVSEQVSEHLSVIVDGVV